MSREVDIVAGVIADQAKGVLRELDRAVDVLANRSADEAGQDEERRKDVLFHVTAPTR